MDGGQPLCHQHRDIAEDMLQAVMLSRSTLVLPDRAQMSIWDDDQLRCAAWVIEGYELPNDMTRCGRWAAWEQDQIQTAPMRVPLCVGHAMALAWSMRSNWNQHLLDDPRPPAKRPGWGWRLAEAWDLPRPLLDRY